MIVINSASGSLAFDSESTHFVKISTVNVIAPNISQGEFASFNANFPSDAGVSYVYFDIELPYIRYDCFYFIRPQLGRYAGVVSIVPRFRSVNGETLPFTIISIKTQPGTQISLLAYAVPDSSMTATNFGLVVKRSNGTVSFSSSHDVFVTRQIVTALVENQNLDSNTPVTMTTPEIFSFDGGLPYFFANDMPFVGASGGFSKCIGVRNNSSTSFSYKGLDTGTSPDFSIVRPRLLIRI